MKLLMKRTRTFAWLSACLLLARPLGAQTQIDLRNQAKAVDFTSSASTRPFKLGTSLPAVCSVGEVFFKSDALPGNNIYACTATNVWTLQTSPPELPSLLGQSGRVLSNDGTSAQWRSLGGDLAGTPDASSVVGLQGRPVASTAPADGEVLKWNQSAGRWQPAAENGGGSGSSSLPSQSGRAHHVLATDGVSPAWRSIVGGATGAIEVTASDTEFSLDLLPSVVPFLAYDNAWTGKQIHVPSAVQVLTGSSQIVANRQNVQVSSQGAVSLNSTPTIADGSHGQFIVITNVNSSGAITLADESQRPGSNLRFRGGTNRTLNPRESVQLVFNGTIGDWIEVGGGVDNGSSQGGSGTGSAFETISSLLDPSKVIYLRDTFTGGTNTSAQLGEMGWFFLGCGTVGMPEPPQFDAAGLFNIATNTTANSICRLTLGPNTTSNRDFIGLNAGTWRNVWRIRLNSTSDVKIFVGKIQSHTVLDDQGYYFKFDSTASPNWIAVSRDSNGVTSTVSEIPATTDFVRLMINNDGATTTYSINGTPVATHTTNRPAGNLHAVIQISPTTTTAKSFDVDDYFLLMKVD